MKKIVLHIGRHKSGTSSIQKFLAECTPFLEKHGILYPSIFRKGIAHHRLAGLLKRAEVRKLSADEFTTRVAEIRAEIVKLLESDHKVIVFSSEALQNCNPKHVQRVFSGLGVQIEVACYFRDQVSYLASSYNQKVHAKLYDVALEHHEEKFVGDYMKFADNWAACFSNFQARVFHRKQLYKNNVIDDFFQHYLGLEIPDEDNLQGLKNKDQNVSLTAEILSFKLELNKRILGGQISLDQLKPEIKSLYQALAKKSALNKDDKFALNRESTLNVISKCEEHNKAFSKKYLHNVPLVFSEPGNGLPILSEDRFKELYREFFRE